MYPWLAFTHSILRYLVIVVAVVAIVRAMQAKNDSRPWSETGGPWAKAFAMTFALQFVLGVVLYFISPITNAGFQSMATAMKQAGLRFFVVEHPFGMLIALALTHMGWIKARKADDAASPGIALKWFVIATLIMLISIPWPFYKAGRALWPSFPG